MKHISGINTPSQRWARNRGACLSGRRRLGRLSIRAYFMRTHQISDMLWVAEKLCPHQAPESTQPYAELEAQYLDAVRHPHRYGKKAWRYSSCMRKALRIIFECYDVRWPEEIL